MNEDQIRKSIHEIGIPEDEKNWLWDSISRKADQHRFQRKRAVTAAAIVFLLLAVPTSVYAATHFQWNWGFWGEKNEELDKHFAREHETLDAQGFRFSLEQALCDKNMGVTYYYMSVTDLSGEGRDPKDYHNTMGEFNLKEGECTYSFCLSDSDLAFERMDYDEKNSTPKTAYFYLEEQLDSHIDQEQNEISINFYQVQTMAYNQKTDKGKRTDTLKERQTMKISNVISMPSLTWNTGDVKMRVSSIAAHIQGVKDPKFEILLKDGTSIRDFTDFTEMGDDKSGQFTFESEKGQIYRFDYIDIDTISGVHLNGTFYLAEQADKE